MDFGETGVSFFKKIDFCPKKAFKTFGSQFLGFWAGFLGVNCNLLIINNIYILYYIIIVKKPKILPKNFFYDPKNFGQNPNAQKHPPKNPKIQGRSYKPVSYFYIFIYSVEQSQILSLSVVFLKLSLYDNNFTKKKLII